VSSSSSEVAVAQRSKPNTLQPRHAAEKRGISRA
jgi:hypothetical protein